ncbi:MAG: TIGR04282 family arsenosugar biosynthesis glycosyltransferase [Rhodocyclaceae bacterium]
MKPVRIVILAKAPRPGAVKTRLIPALGADGAAQLAARMLDDSLAAACAAAVGTVELCASPTLHHPDWQGFHLPAGVVHSVQAEGDLGARMADAAARTLAAGESVILSGTDCAEVAPALFRDAARHLHTADACIHPTQDGGYALLGLNRFDASLFASIRWSTDTVARHTLDRFAALGWQVAVGPMLHDIDEPEDLARMRNPPTATGRSYNF